MVLEVFPVVGVTNWAATEGITDTQLLEASKTRLASFFRIEQRVMFKGRSEVTFGDVDLSSIIDHYTILGFWPVEVLFRASVQPIRGESSLSNNVMESRLPLKPID